MKTYAYFNNRGRIHNVQTGEINVIECSAEVNPETHYFDNATRTIKRMKPQGLRVDGQTVSNVKHPASIAVFLGGNEVFRALTQQDTIVFDFDVPGTYLVCIDPEDSQWMTERVQIQAKP